ncbi:MAG: GntR family transcriptional regulator [Betaproteobacteria bacterium]|nr:MAG: GntR family transcriptional regulator [Betaproteobacteria bacterium]
MIPVIESAQPHAIGRQVLHAAVVAQLRDMITEGQLTPGERLNERVLCEQLGISRTPLREAFKVLATEGLIVLLPNRGAQVAKMGRDEVVHAFQVMGALEGLSGELACANITEEELAEIRELHRQMAACHRKRDLPGYYRLNRAIHERINAAARNPVLTQVYRTVNARLHALRFRSNFDRKKWDAALAEHEQMLEALAARDGERMRRLLVEHLAHKCAAAVLALMESERASAPAADGEAQARRGNGAAARSAAARRSGAPRAAGAAAGRAAKSARRINGRRV